MPQAGFKPPLKDDPSYEADALPTKPPRLVQAWLYNSPVSVCNKWRATGIYYHVLKQTIWLQLSSTEIQTQDPDHDQDVANDALDRSANDPATHLIIIKSLTNDASFCLVQ